MLSTVHAQQDQQEQHAVGVMLSHLPTSCICPMQTTGSLKLNGNGFSWRRAQGGKIVDVKKDGEHQHTAVAASLSDHHAIPRAVSRRRCLLLVAAVGYAAAHATCPFSCAISQCSQRYRVQLQDHKACPHSGRGFQGYSWQQTHSSVSVDQQQTSLLRTFPMHMLGGTPPCSCRKTHCDISAVCQVYKDLQQLIACVPLHLLPAACRDH